MTGLLSRGVMWDVKTTHYVRKRPERPFARFLAGWASLMLGRDEQAEALFDYALVINRSYAPAYIGKICCAVYAGRYYKAAQILYRNAASLKLHKPVQRFRLGSAVSACALLALNEITRGTGRRRPFRVFFNLFTVGRVLRKIRPGAGGAKASKYNDISRNYVAGANGASETDGINAISAESESDAVNDSTAVSETGDISDISVASVSDLIDASVAASVSEAADASAAADALLQYVKLLRYIELLLRDAKNAPPTLPSSRRDAREAGENTGAGRSTESDFNSADNRATVSERRASVSARSGFAREIYMLPGIHDEMRLIILSDIQKSAGGLDFTFDNPAIFSRALLNGLFREKILEGRLREPGIILSNLRKSIGAKKIDNANKWLFLRLSRLRGRCGEEALRTARELESDGWWGDPTVRHYLLAGEPVSVRRAGGGAHTHGGERDEKRRHQGYRR